jgi:NAD(P)H-dependent FMN reductase
MRILAISGSLRAHSSNSALLKAAAWLAPSGMEIVFYEGLGTPVAALRKELGNCRGVLISSPEYARGVAGAMKNALDWLVSSFEFPAKPVALINASPRAIHADAQLRLILATMSACLVEEASITLPVMGRGLDAKGIVEDENLSAQLAAALRNFAAAIEGLK